MQVTIFFDMTTTDFPKHVSDAARKLMLSARGIFDTSAVPDEDNEAAPTPREPAVGQETPQAVKKRGRKSKAELEAEAAAITAAVAEEAAAEPVPEEEKVAFPPSGPAPAMFTAATIANTTGQSAAIFGSGSATPTMAFGSGTPTGFPPFNVGSQAPSQFQTATATVTVQQPAMPPAVEPVIGDDTTVDDLRAIMALANQKSPGLSFKSLQRTTWADGSPKAKWLTAEAVPADVRGRLAGEMAQEASL